MRGTNCVNKYAHMYIQRERRRERGREGRIISFSTEIQHSLVQNEAINNSSQNRTRPEVIITAN